MSRTTLLLSCLAFLSPALAIADDFQGTVQMKVTSDGKSTDLSYETKPGLVKYTMPGGFGSTIMDMNAHQLTIIMDQQHMYMVRPIPVPAATDTANAQGSAPASGQSAGGLVDSLTTDTILGYKCNKYTITSSSGSVTELWAATDLGNFMGFGAAGGNPMGGGRQSAASTSWAKVVAGRGFFPMRVVETVGGKEKTRMEVTSIQKKDLADSEFAPPAGYQAFSVPGMTGGMGR